MIALDPDVRQRLISVLLQLPGMDTVAGRNLLLADLPPPLVGGIVRSENAALDLASIVDAAAGWGALPDSTLALEMLLQNAGALAPDSPLQAALRELQGSLPAPMDSPLLTTAAPDRPGKMDDRTRFQTLIEAVVRSDWPAAANLAADLPANYPGLAPIMAQVRAAQQGRKALYEEIAAAFRAQNWARVLHLAADLPPADPVISTLVREARKQAQGAVLTDPMEPRSQHDAPVYDVAWAPDGTHYASASADGTVCLWVPGEVRSAQTFPGPGGDLNVVAWSPDGRLLAAGGRAGLILVWDVTTGAPIGRLPHPTGVHALAWSPAPPNLLASGDASGVVRLWEVPTAQVRYQDIGHAGVILSLDWAPDGSRLISGAWDATLHVWAAATGSLLASARNQGAGIHSVAWGPAEQGIAVGSNDKQIRIWDEQLQHIRQTLHEPLTGAPSPAQIAYRGGNYTAPAHEGEVYALAWRPDAALLASAASDGVIKLWESNTWQQQAALTRHQQAVNCVAWSPDGKWLVSGSDDTTVRLWPVT